MQGKAKERVKEGQYINKSLFFLTQVIARKSDDKNLQHVPYRNTSLTKMLKSSLGGNTKTCIILCISPAKSQFDHSLQTLKFGLSASRIENKVKFTPSHIILDLQRRVKNEFRRNIETVDRRISIKIGGTSEFSKCWQLRSFESANIRPQSRKRNVMATIIITI